MEQQDHLVLGAKLAELELVNISLSQVRQMALVVAAVVRADSQQVAQTGRVPGGKPAVQERESIS